MADKKPRCKRRRKLDYIGISEENQAKFPEASAENCKSYSQVFGTNCQNNGAAVQTVEGGSKVGGSNTKFLDHNLSVSVAPTIHISVHPGESPNTEIRKLAEKENVSPSSESSSDSLPTKLRKVKQQNRRLKNENQDLRQNLVNTHRKRKPMGSIPTNIQTDELVGRDTDKGETSNVARLKKTENVESASVANLKDAKKTPRKKMKSLEEVIEEISADISNDKVAKRDIMEKCKKLKNKVKTKRLCISKYQDDKVELYQTFDKLTVNCVKKGEKFTDIALSLVESQFLFLNRQLIYKGKQKLEKCVLLSEMVEKISQIMAKQEKNESFREKYYVLDDIVDAMQDFGRIKDYNFGEKILKVSWCLRNYAKCCYHIGDFSKSSEIAKQAICLMRTVYGSEAKRFRVLAYCYQVDFASHCHNSLKDENKAEELKAKAFKVASDAKDWKLDKERTEFKNWINEEFRKAFH